MRTTCFLFFLFLAVTARGQKIEHYYDWNWKPCAHELARYYSEVQKKGDLWVRVDYFIRELSPQMVGSYVDADTKIPQGKFSYYHSNKKLEGTGEFVNGKKEGVWMWFHDNGMMSDSSHFTNGKLDGTAIRWYADGIMKDSISTRPDGTSVQVSWFQSGNLSSAGIYSADGKPTGKWKFYHRNGMLSAVEAYNNGTLLNRQYFDESGNAQADTTSRDRDAMPLTKEGWKKYLDDNAYFPASYRFEGGEQATVIVSFAVDEEGNVTEPKVSYSLHPDFDKIVFDVIKKAPKWLPAIDHNRKIKTYHSQPITFSQTQYYIMH